MRHHFSCRRWPLVTTFAALAAALAAAGCGAPPSTGTSGTASAAPCSPKWSDASGWQCSGTGTVVHVTLKNFAIELPAVLPTGKVTFVVHGIGPTLHEFNVARSDLAPQSLPLASNDTVDDTTNTAHFVWVGQVEGIDIGVTKTFTTNITPGHYDFYCNMDGHYMAAMSAQAVAR